MKVTALCQGKDEWVSRERSMGLCAGRILSFRVPDLTCKHVVGPGASYKVHKWVQQHTEQLWSGVCRKEKQ